MQDATLTRAAVYARVSTEDQAREGHSLGEQERRGLDLIAREGWAYVDTYEDAGVSGTLASRPALDRLLADVAAGRIDKVIVFALDRLARDAGLMRDLLRVLDAAGVGVIAANQALDRATAEGRLQTGILAEFAEFERAKIKDRTRAGIRGRARAQHKPWGSPRYGYRKGADGHWEPDATEVPIIQRIFRERTEHGRSYNQIAQVLNREGIATRHASMWTATTVRAVLTSRAVLGEFFHGGEWLKGTHPAIVDEATWEAAEALAAMGKKYTPSKGGRRPTLHLFTGGLLRCSVCGESMLPRSDRDTYECRTNEVLLGAGSCAMPALPRAEVDRRALILFDEVFLDLDATREHVAGDLDARLHEVLSQAKRAEREATQKQAQVAKVERDYLSGTLSAESYERFSGQLADEVKAADAEAERLTAHAATVRRSRADLDAESETLHRLADLRTSLLASVRTADQTEDIDALRRAMAQVFSVVYADASLGRSERDLGLAIQVRGGRTPVPLSPRETNVSGSGVPYTFVRLFGRALIEDTNRSPEVRS